MAPSRAREWRAESVDSPLSSWATWCSSRGSEEEEVEQGRGREHSGGGREGVAKRMMWMCQRYAQC